MDSTKALALVLRIQGLQKALEQAESELRELFNGALPKRRVIMMSSKRKTKGWTTYKRKKFGEMKRRLWESKTPEEKALWKARIKEGHARKKKAHV